jgi:hypothetical protein
VGSHSWFEMFGRRALGFERKLCCCKYGSSVLTVAIEGFALEDSSPCLVSCVMILVRFDHAFSSPKGAFLSDPNSAWSFLLHLYGVHLSILLPAFPCHAPGPPVLARLDVVGDARIALKVKTRC